jgi:hypothetical protein
MNARIAATLIPANQYEGARSGVGDDHTRADEQPGADHPADRDQPQLPLSQRLLQSRYSAHDTPPILDRRTVCYPFAR